MWTYLGDSKSLKYMCNSNLCHHFGCIFISIYIYVKEQVSINYTSYNTEHIYE
jgi:hypothetical protein